MTYKVLVIVLVLFFRCCSTLRRFSQEDDISRYCVSLGLFWRVSQGQKKCRFSSNGNESIELGRVQFTGRTFLDRKYTSTPNEFYGGASPARAR